MRRREVLSARASHSRDTPDADQVLSPLTPHSLHTGTRLKHFISSRPLGVVRA